ncbi:hypothetical protein FA246_30240, partial [Pseudomonas aeruginosa]|nr:hypothetical protein [Pseudomonas aeruginosa]
SVRCVSETALTLFPAQRGAAHEQIDYLEEPDAPLAATIESRNGALRYQAQRNAAGDLLIDVLAGFSRLSVAYVGDHEAYALAQVASVNQALDNSRVKGVRVRLVGTQVIDDDHRVNTDTLADLKNLFAEGMRQYNPDLVAAFFTGRGTGPGQNSAAGWAYTNGRYSVNAADGPTVFRHELGHNIGGSHCPTGQGFNFGYNNGRIGTIMCGNQLGYYSNPELKDNQGVPIGDALTANMAQVAGLDAVAVDGEGMAVEDQVVDVGIVAFHRDVPAAASLFVDAERGHHALARTVVEVGFARPAVTLEVDRGPAGRFVARPRGDAEGQAPGTG